MTFGKRGASTGSAAAQSRPQDLGPDSGTESEFGLPELFVLLIGLVAVASCIALPIMLWNERSETAVAAKGAPTAKSSAASRKDPTVTSDVAVMDTIRQRMDTGEAGRTYEFAIVAAPAARCFQHLNSTRPWRHPGWTNRAFDQANSILKFEYEIAGEALNCLFTEDKTRFCQAEERGKMARAVASYLKMYRVKLARERLAKKAPPTGQAKMYKDLEERMRMMDPGGDDDPADDLDAFFKGIEAATAAGYFTAADFGSAPELAPHVLPAMRSPCR